ncbi:MAG: 2-oxoglutarate dehydrogenase E1 component [Candidatus Sumerlaeaceae bacterium]
MNNGSALAQNAEYLEQNYRAWKRDPASVGPELAHFFEGFEFAQTDCALMGESCRQQSAVDSLVYHFRDIGHRIAQINPLGDNPASHPELELSSFGLTEEDLDHTFDSNHIPGFDSTPLRAIIAHLKETYCGYIGVEYMHIQETVERRWLQERMEGTRNRPNFTHQEHMRILWKLQKAEMFEQYLQQTYRGQKRFSLEGAETLIPALDRLVECASRQGIVEIVFGMAHRGRLNVLANIIEKSYDEILGEFEDNFQVDTAHGDGDVKYHKGFAKDMMISGRPMHLSLTANPSHLEMVGPVVEGKVRAKQALRGDKDRKTVLPFIIHGDAAFAGQGMVAETFNLAQLKGYRTGGTIHFVINNQVGFTTTAVDYLSGLYCTDVAKMMALPIFHVNGDHPEHVLHCMDMALDYRQKFGKDVVIDMWCYRRQGHNEGDEPSFTQPLLYERIRKHPAVDEIYAAELSARGEGAKEETSGLVEDFERRLEEARRQAAEPPRRRDEDDMLLGGHWHRLKRGYDHTLVETAASVADLRRVGDTLADIPDGLNVHRVPRQQMENIRKSVYGDGALRWAEAELLAFGTLLIEGTGIRLSGEDSGRGTFSQRHAIMYDQKTGEKFIPLTKLAGPQSPFCCYDSSLAELSVLAFDYGYSLGDPSKLIMWEAQFGDFANGAQVIIDQFIAAGESKWGRMSGIVLLLPHGYEGQGPEHSNGWLRRYLTLCAEQNMQVVNATTPAQYFHLLRRQVKRSFRKPLVVMTPKSLLRRPGVTSTVDELSQGTFSELLDDPRGIENPRRVLFCSGKVYYDLMDKLTADNNGDDIAIVRVEQLYPFQLDMWGDIADKYENAKEWVWVSEEPSNFGAWQFMRQHLETLYDNDIWYVGRARSASPATGSKKFHDRQQELLVSYALQHGPLSAELVDGVSVFARGDDLWHMKSRSRRSVSRSAKAPSHSG